MATVVAAPRSSRIGANITSIALFFFCFLPLTLSLSLKERGRCCRLGALPLPVGEGWGEG
jgi:hypothetical protein